MPRIGLLVQPGAIPGSVQVLADDAVARMIILALERVADDQQSQPVARAACKEIAEEIDSKRLGLNG